MRKSSAFQRGVEISSSGESSIATFFPKAERVRITKHNSDWMRTLEKRFNNIVSLDNGWDGYQAKPVSFSIAQFAASIIERLYSPQVPPPSIVPGSDGTMQIEWHFNGYDIELDVFAPLQVEAFRYDHTTEHEEYIEVGSDFTKVAEWIAELGEERRAQIIRAR